MRTLVKKLDAAARLAPALLARAPSFKAVAGALADDLHEVTLSNGETVHLHLPSHTHLNPGDVLLDSMGMMVRVDAAAQAVLAVRHEDAQAMVSLALAATKQGRAMGWQGGAKGGSKEGALLLAQDHALEHYLKHAGYSVEPLQAALNMPLAALPLPEHACGHDAHGGHGHGPDHSHSSDVNSHNHGHDHGRKHEHVHGPDCKH